MIIYDQRFKHADPEEFNTYDGWKEISYHVRKGETAIGRDDDGVALFHSEQVDEDDFGCEGDLHDDWGDRD